MAGDEPKSSAVKDDADEDPYNHPYDGFGWFQNVMDDPNPNLMDMAFTENTSPSMCPPLLPLDVDQTQLFHELDLSISNYDTNDDFDVLSFFDDGFTTSLDMLEPLNDGPNENVNNDSQAEITYDNNNNVGETTRLEVSTRVFGDPNGPNYEIGGTSTIPVASDKDFACDCCTMLRELVHIKEGEIMTTLVIYGGIGFICHAFLHTRLLPSDSTEPQPQNQPEPQKIHLMDLTMEEVKKFIEDYCSQRLASGLSLVQDTNAAFYEAMSVNSIFNQSPPMLAPSTFTEALDVSLVPLNVGLATEEPTAGMQKKKKNPKTPLAAQVWSRTSQFSPLI
ncbi:hypothetical protein CARUB_v10003691mg [Capsella rubella]|uniref:Uncharacterized protein n=1 Tax=Capsella rubella TaxID=81985 RepID=R0H173_9BRAS|nr:hypothetical protein CARUB_v10003691mg [Capsella rubella]